ncbi:MAG: glycosyltransferase family 4 protein [Actinomycetota bacterium]|nr:glycosyltransferase family 4 protein [Actinomycetota bacterium]
MVVGDESSTDEMRVLFVHTATQPPLGADTWVQVQIIATLDRSTHGLHVACATGAPDAPTPTYAALRGIAGIELVPVNFGPELYRRSTMGRVLALFGVFPAILSMARLARYVRRHRIQVLHTTDRPRDALACVVLARLTGARLIVHSHVAYSAEWMGRSLQWSMRRADALVAVSEFVASTLVDGGAEPDHVHVVLNAIELDRWVPGVDRDAARAEFGYSDGDRVVITVCRLFPPKGPDLLIRAVADVRRLHPQVRLLLVGQEMEGGYIDELRAGARALGVEDIITFTGRRSDVPALMAAADLFAMPSNDEPFGLVYAEAMAMELPVVALDNGGTPEVVEHGATGLLSPAGDHEALVGHLAALVADQARCREMGRLGRRHVEERLTLRRQAADMASVYRLVASRPARRQRKKDGKS